MSRAGTPMEAPSANGNGDSARGLPDAVGSAEPVYRFYLSPPPPPPMHPGLAGPQPPEQPRPVLQSPLGLLPLNAYMPMSPPPPQLAGVSAFGHPAYYAPVQQPLLYPSAYSMPAVSGAQAAVGVQPRASTVSSSAGMHQDRQGASASALLGDHDPSRARTPIVNEAGAPVGGFGADQGGQYIEIKFPTFGQAQMQQMLQQLHIQQLQHQQLATAFVAAPASVAHPAQAAARAAGDHGAQPQPQPQQAATPVSAAPSVVAGEKARSATGALDTPSPQSPNISIYDAEAFADAHMEDIVFDRKAFFWKIDNWDKLERRATSDTFKCGGFVWRVLLRPFGSSHKGVLSLFLECLGPADTSEDWRCICRFVLAIANPRDPAHNTHGSAYHCFHRNNPNWGFTRFMKLADLRTSPAPGVPAYIQDGACTIGAYLHVIKDPSH
ncbi:ubiquitin-specific protease ubp15 [Coemansia nantahalensis]|uniref:Ubiquitin-specific protease ubp15 n=1 Tax=Coemansia helicoidea TaxID=1286919 RepID=A0ACC1LHE4_9FUNG|nr:ubiquitin-specific protease ubp15 [Coemansia nantahalensis]KAJ2808291.1 ubiquitin-specific protease ubp15 [Coemansia helicoidea]